MKKILAIVLAIAFSVVGLSADSGFGKGGKGGDKAGLGSVIYSLDLSDDQKTSLRELRQAQRDAKEAQRTADQTTRETVKAQRIEDLKLAFASSTFNEDIFVENGVSYAQTKASEITSNARDRALEYAQYINDMLDILTDDQKVTFFQKVQEL